MKSILPNALGVYVVVHGKRHRLRPTVYNVLMAMDDLNCPMLTPQDRVKLACWRLYSFPRPKDAREAVNVALDYLNEPSPYNTQNDKDLLSLKQDAALICAAFKQLYGVNLPEESRRMDWRYFNALLSGITSETVLGGIMDIRGQKLPKRTATNGEQIAELQKSKLQYRIKHDVKTATRSFSDGLAGMAEVLLSMATEG